MFSWLRSRLQPGPQIAVTALGLVSAMATAAIFGAFEGLELKALDQFFKMSVAAEVQEPRILVVVMDENELAAAGQRPPSEALLSELIQKIMRHQPAVVGLEVNPNFGVSPDGDELITLFSEVPNLIGGERVTGATVYPNATLRALGKSAASDFVVDGDGKIRRGLLSVMLPSGEVKQTLAARLALDYLAKLGVEPRTLDTKGTRLQLGKGQINRFERHDGVYVNADADGFQVLMNYRRSDQSFESVSMSAVLAGQLTDAQVRDRIVIVEARAASSKDVFETPMASDPVAGVYIHAYVVSQLLDLALEGKPLLQTVPNALEYVWVCAWIIVNFWAGRSALSRRALKAKIGMGQTVARLAGVGVSLVGMSYGLLLLGWWLPVVLPMVAMVATVALGMGYRQQQLQRLAAYDELTQVANRGYFDRYLADALKAHKGLSLILCDIDYFKAFNERYGHPAGDRCLHQIAQAIELAIRETDLVARYGGEEFVIVLPETTAEIAIGITERIQQQVHDLKVAHEDSPVSSQVTLSLGVATVSLGVLLLPSQLIACAEKALGEAKSTGRNRVKLSQWQARDDGETMVCSAS